MRIVLISLAVAIGLLSLIAILAYIFQFQLPDDMAIVGKRARKHGMICTKEQELVQLPRKICIYHCADGEKTRIEGVDKCLQIIEL